MGVSALTLGSLMGGATLASGLLSTASQQSQANARADAQAAQAASLRQQAEMQREQGEIAAQQTDKQRHLLRREYEVKQGRNANLLASGNVDLSSGSPLSVMQGNAEAFAADIGENSYQRALNLWENDNRVRSTLYQADSLDAAASSARRQSIVPSLLSTALSAGGSFLTGYSMAGGRIGLAKNKP